MKALKIYEKFNDKSDPIEDMGIGIGALDIYTEVWTVISKGNSEIYKVYLKKEYAERECKKVNKEIYDHSRQINKNMSDKEFDNYYNDLYRSKYVVKSLGDAIDIIKDTIRDDAADPGEQY
jgi:hypothetical protein